MGSLRNTPGPVARSAFKLGMLAAALLGLAAIGALYAAGVADPVLLGYTVVLVFPLYMVLAASAINVWLGYGKDATDLRPVYRPKNP
jgi:hypothetical protein